MADEAETPETETKPAKSPKVATVKMVRDAELYPDGPHEADVHPDEVENFRAGGWEPA